MFSWVCAWGKSSRLPKSLLICHQTKLRNCLKARFMRYDDQDLINKAVGGWVREAGKRDRRKLLSFLDKHAATMPRVALRYAIEHLERQQRDHYLSMKKVGQ